MRIILAFAALVSAVLLLELILRYCVGFPDFGVEKYVLGLDSRGFDKCRIYKPHSGYYTTEGGFKVYRRNNIGLVGSDYALGKKNLYLLGSSYIEAKEVAPAKTASAILNTLCGDYGYQVINIGYRGCTPIEQYSRLRYYSAQYRHDLVVLVLDSTYDQWFKQRGLNKTKSDLIKDFGHDDRLFTHNLYRMIRNCSVLANLMIPSLTSGDIPNAESDANQTEPHNIARYADYTNLIDSIELIKAECPQLVVVSFIEDEMASEILEEKLLARGISYYHTELKKPEFMVNGRGHFNEKGNLLLAEFIYESLKHGSMLTDATETRGQENGNNKRSTIKEDTSTHLQSAVLYNNGSIEKCYEILS